MLFRSIRDGVIAGVLDITTTEGKMDFVRNLVAYNVILEGIWFYSGFMVALSFRQRNLLRK